MCAQGLRLLAAPLDTAGAQLQVELQKGLLQGHNLLPALTPELHTLPPHPVTSQQ